MIKRNIMLLSGLSVVVAGGAITSLILLREKNYQMYNPDKIIKEVKSTFHDVEASYIVKQPSTYSKFGIEYEVFQGGITARLNNKLTHYEFIADAYSGQLIDIKEI
ncbi:hypothetical protein [Staphylococcus massiliensis]|uniref:PepSY domain-containing protein n=1 Tax=Staphylococcus massiliensis S46 TaxID=1229783 RepID=K9B603_9STAP|nr:hypothetical protein [Staphylococcus massiliensis]EKU50257.1 hypothetical protein C273_01405 [Staphylococcus massiliensis S46]MCG3399717.1 hypothetical protein [Staphylococcus massiliensis]MCG3400822.1 hypothetical protein [Staphylococcus massiliensis]MCG3412014.1 hypothetical protein [Staphylococcus massiliensis]PNZ99962.1 hypothetical protein CD133_05410 [Staphylococcus massiliensis CCUG 55927]